jgi:hypothetical protein
MSEVQFAKKHIRNRFSLMILPHISDGIWSVYENAKTICEKNKQVDQTLKTFQNLLTYIPKWDEARLNAEVERIQTASGCSYLEELLTATLITYLRAFASVQYAANQDIEVEFERPPLPRFVHELYRQCARECWTHAYLFKTYSTSMEQQARNRKEIDNMLEASLDATLDSFLPWKSIVEKYFKEPEIKKSEIVPTQMMDEKKDVEEEDDEEEEEVPPAAEKKKVEFEVESDAGSVVSEDGKPNPLMKMTEEECDLDIDDEIGGEEEKPKEEAVDNLEASEELVLNM